MQYLSLKAVDTHSADAHRLHTCSISAAGTDLAATLPLLSAYLVQASTNYSDARPCFNGLLARFQHINATVLLLPSSLEVEPLSLHPCRPCKAIPKVPKTHCQPAMGRSSVHKPP